MSLGSWLGYPLPQARKVAGWGPLRPNSTVTIVKGRPWQSPLRWLKVPVDKRDLWVCPPEAPSQPDSWAWAKGTSVSTGPACRQFFRGRARLTPKATVPVSQAGVGGSRLQRRSTIGWPLSLGSKPRLGCSARCLARMYIVRLVHRSVGASSNSAHKLDFVHPGWPVSSMPSWVSGASM